MDGMSGLIAPCSRHHFVIAYALQQCFVSVARDAAS
jgi:hypothetical protein